MSIWTSRIKFLFLMPAVLWVLTFTVFPLAYSLFLSFHHVERQVVITGREQVPMLDNDGNPIVRSDGTPRTRTVVSRELETTFSWNGSPITSAPSATRRSTRRSRSRRSSWSLRSGRSSCSASCSPGCSTAGSSPGRS